jgi:hypothetical protein
MSNLFNNTSIDMIQNLSKEKTTLEEEKIFRNHVVNFYKKKGYKVWNYTDDTGENDKGINIIAKKNRDIILIHCHLSTTNITTNDLKEFEIQRDKFILEHPLFEGYNITLRYSLTGFFLTEDAFWYIHEHTKIISYEIIK